MKRLIIILLFSSVYGFLHAQETTALQLSLKDAEKIFLERNLSLIAERYNIDMAQAQVTQARLFENIGTKCVQPTERQILRYGERGGSHCRNRAGD